MTYQQAYEYAQSKGYIVDIFPFTKVKGCTITLDGKKCIAIRNGLSEEEMLEILAHEIGHCETNTFYVDNAPQEEKSEAEQIANQWAANFIMNGG